MPPFPGWLTLTLLPTRNSNSNPNQARRPSLGGTDALPPSMQGRVSPQEQPSARKMHSAPPARRRATSVSSLPSMSPSPLGPGARDHTPSPHRRASLPVAVVMAEVPTEQQIKRRAEAEAEAEARMKAKAEARAKAKAEAKAMAEACQQQQKHVQELQKNLAALDSAEMREMQQDSPPVLRLGGDELGLFSASLDTQSTQILDVSQMMGSDMGAPSPLEAPQGEAPPFRRDVKTETLDLQPEMQEDDWMTVYQGGGDKDEQGAQSQLQAQLQAQLQLL